MPKKLKEMTCHEMKCSQCPLQFTDTSCSEWLPFSTFEEFAKDHPEILKEVDMEKEVEVYE